MYYTKYDIEKAQKREKEKLLKYKSDNSYIENFEMLFKKDKIKISINEENYISNYKVTVNSIIKDKLIKDTINFTEKWKKFDNNTVLKELANNRHVYPYWIKYEYKDGELIYNDEYIKRMTPKIKKNFILNMEYLNKLDSEDFNYNLKKILSLKKNNKLKEVTDLKEYIGLKGIYIMVLDKYKQIYIGQSKSDIVERITRHWKRQIEFENLLIGKINETKISIDSFGILDTTRIYIEEIDPSYYNNSEKIEKREEYLVNAFPEKYILNKVGGGIKLGELGSFEKFITTYKKRKLD